MASFNNFVLLIMLTIFLNILVAQADHKRQAILSKEEYKVLARQLKAINKPAIKSFKNDHGEIFDCIDIHKQLAFDHPLLKNHTVQTENGEIHNCIDNHKQLAFDHPLLKNHTVQVKPIGYMHKGMSCPDGTIIVKRTTMKDLLYEHHFKSIGFYPRNFRTNGSNIDVTGHHFAQAEYKHDTIFGVKANINLWNPNVLQKHASLASMAIAGGPSEVASISVGWMVNPLIYQDHFHLYTYWTADGYDKTGCYDTRCPGFVQVSKTIPVGMLLKSVSIYNGAQYEMGLTLHQDKVTGDWWFIYGKEKVGYWPSSLFKASGIGLVKGATFANFGGQVYSPLTEPSPVMGSGHFPDEGLGKAAYINNFQIIDGSGTCLIPQIYTIHAYESIKNCYKAKYIHKGNDVWMRAVFYGGPGGCIG